MWYTLVHYFLECSETHKVHLQKGETCGFPISDIFTNYLTRQKIYHRSFCSLPYYDSLYLGWIKLSCPNKGELKRATRFSLLKLLKEPSTLRLFLVLQHIPTGTLTQTWYAKRVSLPGTNPSNFCSLWYKWSKVHNIPAAMIFNFACTRKVQRPPSLVLSKNQPPYQKG